MAVSAELARRLAGQFNQQGMPQGNAVEEIQGMDPMQFNAPMRAGGGMVNVGGQMMTPEQHIRWLRQAEAEQAERERGHDQLDHSLGLAMGHADATEREWPTPPAPQSAAPGQYGVKLTDSGSPRSRTTREMLEDQETAKAQARAHNAGQAAFGREMDEKAKSAGYDSAKDREALQEWKAPNHLARRVSGWVDDNYDRYKNQLSKSDISPSDIQEKMMGRIVENMTNRKMSERDAYIEAAGWMKHGGQPSRGGDGFVQNDTQSPQSKVPRLNDVATMERSDRRSAVAQNAQDYHQGVATGIGTGNARILRQAGQASNPQQYAAAMNALGVRNPNAGAGQQAALAVRGSQDLEAARAAAGAAAPPRNPDPGTAMMDARRQRDQAPFDEAMTGYPDELLLQRSEGDQPPPPDQVHAHVILRGQGRARQIAPGVVGNPNASPSDRNGLRIWTSHFHERNPDKPQLQYQKWRSALNLPDDAESARFYTEATGREITPGRRDDGWMSWASSGSGSSGRGFNLGFPGL